MERFDESVANILRSPQYQGLSFEMVFQCAHRQHGCYGGTSWIFVVGDYKVQSFLDSSNCSELLCTLGLGMHHTVVSRIFILTHADLGRDLFVPLLQLIIGANAVPALFFYFKHCLLFVEH